MLGVWDTSNDSISVTHLIAATLDGYKKDIINFLLGDRRK